MSLLRTRFKKDIVAEFLLPRQVRGKRQKSKEKKVVIICDGMPSTPGKRSLVEFFSKKGYWAFYPRYRGSWESGGTFLKYSPEKDVLDVIGELPKGFVSLGDGKKYKVRPEKIYLVAGSFGGPAGILASRDPRVTKVVAISPVVDWRAPSKAEPLGWLEKFTHRAFGEGYRFGKKEWAKLKTGKFYNPAAHADEIDGRKLFIFHAKDDESVGWRPVMKFAEATGAKFKLFKRGGHLGSVRIIQKYYPKVAEFFKRASSP